MPKIIKNGKEYSGVPIEVVTAWAPTADPVQVKEPLMGNTDISDIGDGTVTGAIDTLNDGLTDLFIIKNYSATVNVSANSSGYATATALGMSTPSGYTPVAAVTVSCGSSDCPIYVVNVRATGGQGAVWVRNVTSSTVNNITIQLRILYAKTSFISES